MLYSTSIGLDTHARSISAAAFVFETGEVMQRTFGYDLSAAPTGSFEIAINTPWHTGKAWPLQPSENGTEKRYHPQTERQALLNTGIPGRSPLPAATAAAKPPRPPRCQEHLATAGREKSASAPNPTTWEQRKLGDMGTAFGGLTGKSKEDFGHGAAWFVPYTNVFDNPVGDASRLERVEIDPSQNVVRGGDALFTVSSETPEEVGMSCVWPSDLDNLYLNSFCFGYRQDGTFDPSYLAYMLRADSFRNQVEMLAQGISRFNISKGKVMEIEVPVPDKEEQTLIGRFFVDLDNLITLHQREQGMFGIRNGAWNGMRKPLALRTPRTASSPFHTPTVARIDEADGAEAAATEVVSSERPFALRDASRTAGRA